MASLSDSQLERIADGEDPTRVLLSTAMKEPRGSSAFARSTPVEPSWLEYQERGLACGVSELPARVGARVLLLRGACPCRCKVCCGKSVESAKRGGRERAVGVRRFVHTHTGRRCGGTSATAQLSPPATPRLAFMGGLEMVGVCTNSFCSSPAVLSPPCAVGLLSLQRLQHCR